MDITKIPLSTPHLEKVAEVLQRELPLYFKHAIVEIIDCPNLMKPPFNLAASGLCGEPLLLNIGSVANIKPHFNREKYYYLKNIPTWCQIHENILVIGAGGGPWKTLGKNSELMANLYLKGDGTVLQNKSLIAVTSLDNTYSLQSLDINETGNGILSNLFVCQGNKGKVLKIHVQHRKTDFNFIESIQNSLKSEFADVIGLGGVFVMEKGEALLHIMPQEFSKTPLESDEDINNWLQFYNMPSPLIGLSFLLSHDPETGTRLQHTHCYSSHGHGGHYHKDVTPSEVEYKGYFNIANYLICIDSFL